MVPRDLSDDVKPHSQGTSFRRHSPGIQVRPARVSVSIRVAGDIAGHLAVVVMLIRSAWRLRKTLDISSWPCGG